jgi:hypothetical protein
MVRCLSLKRFLNGSLRAIRRFPGRRIHYRLLGHRKGLIVRLRSFPSSTVAPA